MPHPIHYQAGNCLGTNFLLHILSYGFNGAGAQEYFFGDLFRGFVLGNEFEDLDLFFRKLYRVGIKLPDSLLCCSLRRTALLTSSLK